MKVIFWSFSAATILLLAGCAEREATVYEVPKETATPPVEVAAMPIANAPYAQGGTGRVPPSGEATPGVTKPTPDDMATRTLPASALNQSGNPNWTVPAQWQSAPAGNMRRATFRLATGAEVAITSFPGDVGGDLANVNRWRRQIGLSPIGPDALASALSPIALAGGGNAQIVNLTGPSQSTLAAIIPHAGNTWFAKLTADAGTIAAEESAFRNFVASWDFAASPAPASSSY